MSFSTLTRTSNTDPPRKAALITKSDTTVLNIGGLPCRGVYVGGTGHVNILFVDDTAPVLFSAVPVGTTIHGVIKKVYSTDTTATLMVALY